MNKCILMLLLTKILTLGEPWVRCTISTQILVVFLSIIPGFLSHEQTPRKPDQNI